MGRNSETAQMQRVHFDKPADRNLPPHNLEAEAAVLGGVLYDNESFWRVAEILRADDFYAPAHKWLWRRISALIETGRVADGIVLADAADREPKVKEIGGQNYLLHLLDGAAVGFEVRDYAKMVAELSGRRAILAAADGLREAAGTPLAEASTADVLSEARQLIDKVEDRHLVSAPSVAETADATFEENLKALLVESGFWSLDKDLGGMVRGGVTLIGARPGVGKTAMGLCLAAHVAERGETVGFFQADMTAVITQQRLAWYLAHRAGDQLPYFSEMRRPGSPWITPDFRKRMAGHLKTNTGRRIMITDRPGLNTQYMRYQIRTWKREAAQRGLPPLGMVMVDHIGKLSPSAPYRGLYEKTSFASNELLEIAKENPEIAFVAMAQLSRANSHDGRRPTLADLRDSGKLEEDASAVILLHREDMYLSPIVKNLSLPESERAKADEQLQRVRGHMEAIIAKNREGETTTVIMRHTIGKNIIRDASREEAKEIQEVLL